MPPLRDLTGLTFGRWTALRRGDDHVTPSRKRSVRWHCRCACGASGLVLAVHLLRLPPPLGCPACRRLVDVRATVWTPAMLARLGTAHDRDLAAELGISESVIWCKRVELGRPAYRPAPVPPPGASDELLTLMARIERAGSKAALARELGVTRQTIHNRLRTLLGGAEHDRG